MTTGKRIRELRTERGMTLEDLGKLMGVTKATVFKWEDGITVNLKRDIIQKLSDLFDVSPTYIMGMSSVRHPTKALKIPLLGTIAAGTPILAEENITEYFNLDSSVRAACAQPVGSVPGAFIRNSLGKPWAGVVCHEPAPLPPDRPG